MLNYLKALIVDDEPELRKTVATVLKNSFPEIELLISEASNGVESLNQVKHQEYDIVLMDVRMPEMDGLTTLKHIKEHDPRTFVVIMTAHSNLTDAVEAIKNGAYDYLEKPVQPKKLKELIRKALEARELVSHLALSSPIFDDDVDSELVGSSQKMREIFDLIFKLSQVDTSVLIRGENGTGKKLAAKAIHYNSPRKHGDFVAINCEAIPGNLMESELFGHEKGAFTDAHERKIGKFQLANKGTIFLDEIGELQIDMQAKLLRVLQEGRFIPINGNREIKTNARIIAATNRNLEKMIEEGKFRKDLFYHLNVIPLFLPPLHERLDDISGLVDYFIRRFNRAHHKQITGVDNNAVEKLKAYHWPGNIRELEGVIERAFIIETGSSISIGSLPEHVVDIKPQGRHMEPPHQYYFGPMDYDRFKKETEKEFIVAALSANCGRINKTVAQANIPKNTLLRKIKKYGINVKELGRSEK